MKNKFKKTILNLLLKAFKLNDVSPNEHREFNLRIPNNISSFNSEHPFYKLLENVNLIAVFLARQGSGLGLVISKAYVEMLGRKIWVESRESKGSTFYFTLPLTNYDKEKTVVSGEIPVDNKNDKTKQVTRSLRILIAEDDEASRNYISIIAKDYSAEILETGTGIETVELCRKHKDIDLILMDIQMPVMNGYDATRRIREFNKEVIIIAQTAFGLSGDRGKAIESGCNDYIAKPVNKNELLTLIQKYFGK